MVPRPSVCWGLARCALSRLLLLWMPGAAWCCVSRSAVCSRHAKSVLISVHHLCTTLNNNQTRPPAESAPPAACCVCLYCLLLPVLSISLTAQAQGRSPARVHSCTEATADWVPGLHSCQCIHSQVGICKLWRRRLAGLENQQQRAADRRSNRGPSSCQGFGSCHLHQESPSAHAFAPAYRNSIARTGLPSGPGKFGVFAQACSDLQKLRNASSNMLKYLYVLWFGRDACHNIATRRAVSVTSRDVVHELFLAAAVSLFSLLQSYSHHAPHTNMLGSAHPPTQRLQGLLAPQHRHLLASSYSLQPGCHNKGARFSGQLTRKKPAKSVPHKERVSQLQGAAICRTTAACRCGSHAPMLMGWRTTSWCWRAATRAFTSA